MPPSKKSALTPSRRRLVELMQRVNFGRVECFLVRGGEPVLDPPPRVVLEVKLGGENGPRPETDSAADFALKAQVINLFEHFDRLGDAGVEVLTVKHGLPFSMHVEAHVRP